MEEPLRLSEWADKYFKLSPESSYLAGDWITYPYQRAIMDVISNDDIPRVILKKPRRLGFTKMTVAEIAYAAVRLKRNVVSYHPTDGDAKGFVKDEIDPMLRDVACMSSVFSAKIGDTRSSSDTLEKKRFRGSVLDIKGGKSPGNYRRITKDIAIADELDEFEPDVGDQGDPIALIEGRIEGAVFPKLILGSTPTIKDASLIDTAHENAELKLIRLVPCPHCGAYQELVFDNLRCENKKPETVHYLCPHCKQKIGNELLDDMDEQGIWCNKERTVFYDDDTGAFLDQDGNILSTPKSVAFHIWQIFSRNTTWANIMRQWFEAQAKPEKLKTFINQVLAEVWEERGEHADHEKLMTALCVQYEHPVPEGILMITAGVDVQTADDLKRLEISVYGWGENERSALIEHAILYGDPHGDEVWEETDEYLNKTWPDWNGLERGIDATFIDSGDGNVTARVYKFTASRQWRHIYASKGKGGDGVPVIDKPSIKEPYKAKLFSVGVDEARAQIIARHDDTIITGQVHDMYPMHQQFVSEEFFKQMTSYYRKRERGKLVWKHTRERREAFDCKVYALAAMRFRLSTLISWSRIKNSYFHRLKNQEETRAPDKPIYARPGHERRRPNRRGPI